MSGALGGRLHAEFPRWTLPAALWTIEAPAASPALRQLHHDTHLKETTP